jgi:hypothetical protein
METAGTEASEECFGYLPVSCLLFPVSFQFDGADRDRTGDPLVANQVLSQLSYRPFTSIQHPALALRL